MSGMDRTVPRCLAAVPASQRRYRGCCKARDWRIRLANSICRLQTLFQSDRRLRSSSTSRAVRPFADPPDPFKSSRSVVRSAWVRTFPTNSWATTTRTRRLDFGANFTVCPRWREEIFTGADGTRRALSSEQLPTIPDPLPYAAHLTLDLSRTLSLAPSRWPAASVQPGKAG